MTAEASSLWKDLLANPGPDGHIVQLYQDEEFLGEAVSHFVAEGLAKGEAIIVATEPHWVNISSRLVLKGFDLESLGRRGQITLLNANETLPKFLVHNIPDAKSFKDIARAPIEKARAGGRYPRVRWWGEMVNVLYVNGNSRGSTRLEELFDEVAHEESIAIFCSFLMDKFDPKIYEGPLQESWVIQMENRCQRPIPFSYYRIGSERCHYQINLKAEVKRREVYIRIKVKTLPEMDG